MTRRRWTRFLGNGVNGGLLPDRIPQAVSDWWQFAAFLAAAVVAYVTGRERQRWHVHELGEKIDRQDAEHNERMERLFSRVAQLERDTVQDGRMLASIDATQKQILSTLGQMRAQLDQKQDRSHGRQNKDL